MRRLVAAAALVGLLASAVACDRAERPGPAPGEERASTGSPAFCRRLRALDDLVREVRSWMEPTVARYAAAVERLDRAYRRARAVAPEEVDLAPIEYANGRFGEIVRGLAPDLDPASVRAALALNLEGYAAALYRALVDVCGPASVED
ncbi:hypothetical protein HRbin12_00617 [bacterium HR12]|nr:hypothetical protein HRbin12_00617 [bacterium HR12]GIU98589.1 MAG: hypothetical protein KatS3mg014_0205 [Actinomycetota bacterium]